MNGPTRIHLPPSPRLLVVPRRHQVEAEVVVEVLIMAALTALLVAFVAVLLEARALRADLVDVQSRLAVVGAVKADPAPAAGFASVEDALGSHAQEVIEQPRDGEVVP